MITLRTYGMRLVTLGCLFVLLVAAAVALFVNRPTSDESIISAATPVGESGFILSEVKATSSGCSIVLTGKIPVATLEDFAAMKALSDAPPIPLITYEERGKVYTVEANEGYAFSGNFDVFEKTYLCPAKLQNAQWFTLELNRTGDDGRKSVFSTPKILLSRAHGK